MEKGNNIELRTDDVRDILQKMPNWTIRWGISVLFGAVFLLFLFSYLYRSPDIIASEVVISASNPPAEIKARSTGKIMKLLVLNGEKVSSNQLLAVVENPALIDQIMKVQDYLIQLEPFLNNFDETMLVESPPIKDLGEVQSSYSDLHKLLSDYRYFIQQDYYHQRIDAIVGQIETQKQLQANLNKQLQLQEERFILASKIFQRDSLLMNENIIASEDFDQSKSTWLNAGLSLELLRNQSINTRSSIFELQQQKVGLQLDYQNELKFYRTNISKTCELVKNNVEHWYLSYALISPIDGVASFNKIWALNQNISEGETVMTIVPEQPEGILGKAYIPINGAGKVKTGQRVMIKLSNYPYMEYGMLIGSVQYIAPVPVNNFYSIEIELPNQLTTNYGKKLPVQQELWGSCEIITDDLRLIQRLIYPVKAVIERNRRKEE